MQIKSRINKIVALILTMVAIGVVPIYGQAGTSLTQTIFEITECNDGIDNDFDGGIDFASDPECTGWDDTSELGPPPPPPTPPSVEPEQPESTPVISSTDLPNIPIVEILPEPVANILHQFIWKPVSGVLARATPAISKDAINPVSPVVLTAIPVAVYATLSIVGNLIRIRLWRLANHA